MIPDPTAVRAIASRVVYTAARCNRYYWFAHMCGRTVAPSIYRTIHGSSHFGLEVLEVAGGGARSWVHGTGALVVLGVWRARDVARGTDGG